MESSQGAGHFIVRFTEKNVTSHSFQAIFLLRDWKYLGERALDLDENAFETDEMRSALSGRVASELISVELLGRAYIESHKEAGAKIKIYGKAGEEIVDVPADLIQEFLACDSKAAR